jgi:NAD(P)H-hydrate epimerase
MPEAIISVAEMREREARTWAAGISQESVIRRAGVAVAQAVLRRTRRDDPVLVLAGTGHNGDDAAVADQHLAERDSLLLRFHDTAAYERAHTWLSEYRGNPRALIVDGLFGIGLSRPLEGEPLRLVKAINQSGIRVISVDVPSGLNADTGEPEGAAVEAAITVTLGSVKRGLLRRPAAPYVGRLELADDIGLIRREQPAQIWWTLARDFDAFPPRRPDDGHKGSFGHVAVLAGSLGFHGAGVLAAQGAARARPGLITVHTDEQCYGPVASQLRAAMVRPWRGEPIADNGYTAIVIGPGLASPGLPPQVWFEIARLWRTSRAVIVADASALGRLPQGTLESTAGPRIITPHPGEAARLLQIATGEIEDDRFLAVRRLAQLWPGARLEVVLKGRHSVVGGGADGSVFVNSSGNPGLAQGGTGDILAGYLAGLLAQPVLQESLQHTVRFAVWRHGAAADLLENRGEFWTPEDLLEALKGS